MIKTIGYYLFALVYFLCKPFPIKHKRVLCIATHEEGESSNVNITARALDDLKDGYTFSYITKGDTKSVKSMKGLRTLLCFFFRKPYELARAEIVLLDNVFLPFAYLHRKKETRVVQLWHGTGTIKKFGQDVNTGKLKKLENRANSNITHLIVNSEEMQKLYSRAFGVKEEFIYPIGLPKTDELLMRIKKSETDNRNTEKEYIYQKYKIPREKKLVLYAPTFRDDAVYNLRLMEQLKQLSCGLSEEYYLGLRLHPFIADKFMQEQLETRTCQLSFEQDLNTILLAADILITDYSSIIFEYCLTERPMIFYAYDYEDFSDSGRGFYNNYESYVPGPVAYSCEEVIRIIKANNYDYSKIKEFNRSNYLFTDGKATKRLIDLLEQKRD